MDVRITMSDNRREEFVKRLSTVGFGARESIQVMLSNVVFDIREQVVHKRFREEEMDEVIAFHDAIEALWQDAIATTPPISPAELYERLGALAKRCVGPLGQFESKMSHGVRGAEQLVKGHEKA
jgi:hypothetical protein